MFLRVGDELVNLEQVTRVSVHGDNVWVRTTDGESVTFWSDEAKEFLAGLNLYGPVKGRIQAKGR